MTKIYSRSFDNYTVKVFDTIYVEVEVNIRHFKIYSKPTQRKSKRSKHTKIKMLSEILSKVSLTRFMSFGKFSPIVILKREVMCCLFFFFDYQ